MALSASAVGSYGALNGYWGQYGTDSLRQYCDSGIKYVTMGFVNRAPEHEPSGYPGDNFAGHCWAGTYTNSKGVASNLLSECQTIKADIPYCQAKGVKVLLSIGGDYSEQYSNYKVTTKENGKSFADFLYKAFGPYNPAWTGPRPFDSDTGHVSVDGFDFDIELQTDNAPYVTMVQELRALNPAFFISAAPQCPTSDPYFYLKDLIHDAQFDALFVQFYNNPVCDAIPGNAPDDGFNYAQWENIVSSSAKSSNAKLYIGLPSSPQTAGSGYITPQALKDLVCKYKGSKHFGGISLWDLSRPSIDQATGKTYTEQALEALKYGCDPIPTTTTTSMKSSSTHTSSTSSKKTTTTSSRKSSTSTKKATTTSKASSYARSVSVSTTDLGSPDPVSSGAADPGSPTGSADPHGPTGSALGDPLTTSSRGRPTGIGMWNTTMTTMSSTSDVAMTTSTVYTTSVYTVTKCPVYVTDCPAGPYVTTVTVPLYTTVCPITEGREPSATAPASSMTAPPAPWTTSTVYTTTTYTITACPSEVHNCPVGAVTTEVIPWYTTICPVVATATGEVMPQESATQQTVTTSTQYTTVKVRPVAPGAPSGPNPAVVQPATMETATRPTVFTPMTRPTAESVPGSVSTNNKPGAVTNNNQPGAVTNNNQPGAVVPASGSKNDVAPANNLAAQPSMPVTAGGASLAVVGLTSLIAAVAFQVFAL